MSDLYRENVLRWAELVEIDYFTMFVKAWIPFNAWFQRHFEEDRDRQILNALKNGTDNPLRSAVLRLLVRDDPDGITFRGYLAQLHTQLEERELTV